MNAVPLLSKQESGAPSDSNSKGSGSPSFPMEGPAFQSRLDKVLGVSESSGVEELKGVPSEGSKAATQRNLEESLEKSNESGVQASFLQKGSPLMEAPLESAFSGLKSAQLQMTGRDAKLQVAEKGRFPGSKQTFESGLIPLPEGYESLLSANPIELELESLEEKGSDLKDFNADRLAPVENGLDVMPLLSRLNARLEEAKVGASSDAKGVLPQQATGLPSRVSTEDFLNLREMRKEKGKLGVALDTSAPLISQEMKGNLHLGPVVDAPVTQGTAGKTILSHDAIHQISHQVNILGQARQDGEIKIRLKPDHLGELVMNVKSRGNEVSIQIKTHDLEAKKIIEESIGRLKESLTIQNLQLSRMDVVTQPAPMQGAENQMQMDFNQNQSGFGRNDPSGWTGTGEGGRQEFLYEENQRSATLNTMTPFRNGSRTGTGNLDLIA